MPPKTKTISIRVPIAVSDKYSQFNEDQKAIVKNALVSSIRDIPVLNPESKLELTLSAPVAMGNKETAPVNSANKEVVPVNTVYNEPVTVNAVNRTIAPAYRENNESVRSNASFNGDKTGPEPHQVQTAPCTSEECVLEYRCGLIPLRSMPLPWIRSPPSWVVNTYGSRLGNINNTGTTEWWNEQYMNDSRPRLMIASNDDQGRTTPTSAVMEIVPARKPVSNSYRRLAQWGTIGGGCAVIGTMLVGHCLKKLGVAEEWKVQNEMRLQSAIIDIKKLEARLMRQSLQKKRRRPRDDSSRWPIVDGRQVNESLW